MKEAIQKRYFTLAQLAVKFKLNYITFYRWHDAGEGDKFENFLKYLNSQPSPTKIEIKNWLKNPINELQSLNTGQNTHTASTHLSASYQALQLQITYKDDKNIKNTINSYQKDIYLLFPQACHEAINFIFDLEFTDPVSNISVKQLLRYLYFEVKKIRDKQDEKSFKDTENMLINGLNDIMHDVDDKGRNTGTNICPPGTFNKLTETIAAINCTEMTLIFITQESITNKFYVILKACIEEHLNLMNHKDKPNTIKRISDKGVSGIWSEIGTKVEEQVRTEFMITKKQFPCTGFSKEQTESIQIKIEETNKQTNTNIDNIIKCVEYMSIPKEMIANFITHQENKEEKEEKQQELTFVK